VLDTILMIAATGFGYANVPWWSAVAIGLLLTALASPKQVARGRRYAELGPVRIIALSVGATVANNVAFAFMAWALGRAGSWLLAP
jgi:hypothetical protein